MSVLLSQRRLGAVVVLHVEATSVANCDVRDLSRSYGSRFNWRSIPLETFDSDAVAGSQHQIASGVK